jgi:hypothetical protein
MNVAPPTTPSRLLLPTVCLILQRRPCRVSMPRRVSAKRDIRSCATSSHRTREQVSFAVTSFKHRYEAMRYLAISRAVNILWMAGRPLHVRQKLVRTPGAVQTVCKYHITVCFHSLTLPNSITIPSTRKSLSISVSSQGRTNTPRLTALDRCRLPQQTVLII